MLGMPLTYWVLSAETGKVIPRSEIRSALKEEERNIRLEPTTGEDKPLVIKDRYDSDYVLSDPTRMPTIQPDDLLGRTFLKDPNEDGERFRARVVRKIIDNPNLEDPTFENIKFILKIDGAKADEIVSYNEVLDQINKVKFQDELDDTDGAKIWRFRQITGHAGPLSKRDKNYKGSPYNVLVEWETGETTYEPLHVIAQDDPVTCAIYAKNNGLLDTPGWKRFKQMAKRDKRMLREINQSKLRQVRRSVKYKFGYQVPRDYHEALELDKLHGNTKWQDCTKLELDQIDEYETFEDRGKAIFNGREITNAPANHKKIRVHLVFDVKHDGRHKARLVADGHLTEEPVESVYSSVVSLRSLRLVTFLAELNSLELWGADISNAYLYAKTSEKIYIVAGKEFGSREGHILVIRKALYGLRTSGKRWHETLADCLRDLGFNQSKADSDVWMRKSPAGCYEYLAVYVDDLLIVMKDPAEFCKTLKETYHFKMKGDGPLDYHLGMNYIRESDGTLKQIPQKYIEKMMASYEAMFKEQPKKAKTPLEKGDHPEIDTSELLDSEGVTKFQSMIGQLQWLVTLGRIDIFSAVVTMSRFRAAPRQGHLDRLKRVYGYVRDTKHGCIRVRTDEPDYSSYPDQVFDWSHTIYGDVQELVPDDAPEPLGKPVVLTTYVDANLYHDLVSGRALTAVLHLINQTPFDWYCKRQATVETATYSSEFVAARSAVEQIIDIRTTLRYLGVPVQTKSYMFGDNQSVVTNSTLPHSQLNKRHQALAYHKVREAIASGMIGFYHINGDRNPADILSKHWGFPQVWPLLKPLLFWQGETMSIPDGVKSKTVQVNQSIQDRGECYICPQSSVAKYLQYATHITKDIWIV